MRKTTIAILGAGAWGTALAQYFSSIGNEVYLWHRDKIFIDNMSQSLENKKYLPEVKLNENIRFTDDLDICLSMDFVFVAIPTQALKDFMMKIKSSSLKNLIICSKGIDHETEEFYSKIAKQLFPATNIAVLSGPNFAIEIARSLPTTTTIASDDILFGEFCNQVSSKAMKFYYTEDVVSVEVFGSCKNILAIGCGVISALGLGDNYKASFIAEGINQINMLAKALGGNEGSIFLPAGIADIVLTCNSTKSRNFSFGVNLVEKNISAQELINSQNTTVEGYFASKVIKNIVNNRDIDLSIFDIMYKMLHNDASHRIMKEFWR